MPLWTNNMRLLNSQLTEMCYKIIENTILQTDKEVILTH